MWINVKLYDFLDTLLTSLWFSPVVHFIKKQHHTFGGINLHISPKRLIPHVVTFFFHPPFTSKNALQSPDGSWNLIYLGPMNRRWDKSSKPWDLTWWVVTLSWQVMLPDGSWWLVGNFLSYTRCDWGFMNWDIAKKIQRKNKVSAGMTVQLRTTACVPYSMVLSMLIFRRERFAHDLLPVGTSCCNWLDVKG